ncbi:MAG: Nramp family divalent metal transporter [Candidatus Blackburnbacteria bacterium]|nr:Nramp family divalent metal transporter [Candidatus Blackburnbacteria bacterium]
MRKFFRRWVPSIISGASDNDPAAIGTYAISGAQFGFGQLWLVFFATPMLIAVQAMCARLGDVTRKGIMTIVKEHYTPVVAIIFSTILVTSNIATIGADLAGMADAMGLVTNTAFIWWVIPISLFMWYIVVFQNYRILEKYLFFLTFIFLAYIVSAVLAKPNWLDVWRHLVLPSFLPSPAYFEIAVALLGSTITPYVFFWQAKQGIEEHKSSRELTSEAKKEDATVAPGFIYANIISLFIMISTAAVLHGKDGSVIVSAAQAARAFEPLAGPLAKYLFAIGIIGAGLLAVPVIAASTAYVVAETFGWKESLSDKVNKAKGFYTVLTASILVGIGIAISGIDPMQALLYSQVLTGILTPFLIALILFMCNDKKIMGSYVNRWFDNLFGWTTVVVMILASVGLFWQLVSRIPS